jgi:hypothetical protein
MKVGAVFIAKVLRHDDNGKKGHEDDIVKIGMSMKSKIRILGVHAYKILSKFSCEHPHVILRKLKKDFQEIFGDPYEKNMFYLTYKGSASDMLNHFTAIMNEYSELKRIASRNVFRLCKNDIEYSFPGYKRDVCFNGNGRLVQVRWSSNVINYIHNKKIKKVIISEHFKKNINTKYLSSIHNYDVLRDGQTLNLNNPNLIAKLDHDKILVELEHLCPQLSIVIKKFVGSGQKKSVCTKSRIHNLILKNGIIKIKGESDHIYCMIEHNEYINSMMITVDTRGIKGFNKLYTWHFGVKCINGKYYTEQYLNSNSKIITKSNNQNLIEDKKSCENICDLEKMMFDLKI